MALPLKRDPHEQDISLRFTSAALEDEYVAFVHPKPLIAFPVTYCIATLLYLNSMLTRPGLLYELNVTVLAISSVVCILIHITARRRGGATAQMLSIERNVLVCTISFLIAKDLSTNLRHFQTCEAFSSIRVDQRLAYVEPNCRSWWSPFGVMLHSTLVIPQVIKFYAVALTAVYAIAVHCLLWLLITPPDPVVQVWMYAAYVTAGVGFVTFVRYDQEQVQRKHFLRYDQFKTQQERLEEKERSLNAYCMALLPRSFLKRLNTVDDTNKTLDFSDNGAVLLAGVHEFGVWCTQHTPADGASAIVMLHSTVRTIANKYGMDVIGCRGDTIVCMANLIQRAPQPRTCTRSTALEILELREAQPGAFPPIRAAMNFGRLEGGFVGTVTIRYDVFGPCYDVAQEALLECPADHVMASVSTQPLESTAGDPSRAIHLATVRDAQFEAWGPTQIQEALSEDPSQVASGTSAFLFEAGIVPIFDGAQEALRRTLAEASGGRSASYAQQRLEDSSLLMYPSTTEYGHGGERRDDTDVLQAKLERYKEVKTVWCCFPRFADDEVEEAYVAERMEVLPGAASRTWFAYALYVLVILILLLVDMQEPTGVVGVTLIVVAILMSVTMGILPVLLGKQRMSRWFFPWSVVGVVLPLLVVYGAALSRPAAVGNDTRLFLFIGALVRSYCFTSSRWQAVFVPLAALAGLGQYGLPGAHLRITILFVYLLIAFSIIADREREGSHRENVRRKVELQFILARLGVAEKLRRGLLRNAVPKQILPSLPQSGSLACQCEGAAIAIRACPMSTPNQNAAGAPLAIAAQRFALLETLLENTTMLAIGNILGDQAMVVGPVSVIPEAVDDRNADIALTEALQVAVRHVEEHDSAPDGIRYAALVDFDSVVHAVQVSHVAQYWALGVTVTRLLTFLAATDAAAHVGCLMTERVVTHATSLGLLDRYHVFDTGRMKLRGLGVIRLSKLSSQEDAPRNNSFRVRSTTSVTI